MRLKRRWTVALVGVLVCGAVSSAQNAPPATMLEAHASAVVLDLETGAVLDQVGLAVRATPGSTLKPLLLQYALDHGIVSARTTVMCHRQLRIGRRMVPCTHPADEDVFTAENALAESCNSYFAEVGRRFTAEALEDALRRTRLTHRPMSGMSAEGRELTVLGLENVTATPVELARAYRELAMRMPADGPVARGLQGSVEYGMAHGAAAGGRTIEGKTILGKTGTARDPGESWTHGWFAGIADGRVAIVVYVPHGDGGTAAGLARVWLDRSVSRPARGKEGER